MNQARLRTVTSILTGALTLGLGSANAGLLGYWDFNDGTGSSIAADSSGQGHDGALTNMDAASDWVTGRTGLPGDSALNFDGANDFVNIPAFRGVTGRGARTVSAWIRTSETSINRAIASWGTNTAGEKWTFRVQTNNGPIDNNLRVEVNGGFQIGTAQVNNGMWRHVACTWESDTSPDVTDVKLYVDGTLEAVSSSLTEPINTARLEALRIGRDFQTARFWRGDLDDIAIFNRALTAAEITALAAGTSPLSVEAELPKGSLDFNAGLDPSPTNGTWEDLRGLDSAHNWAINNNAGGARRVAISSDALPGLTHAYTFNGGSDTATAATLESFAGNPSDDSASFELAFKPSDISGQEVLWETGGTNGSSLTIDDDKILFTTARNAPVGQVVYTGLNAAKFVHIVGVIGMNGSPDTNGAGIELYVNGVSAGSVNNPNFIDWTGANGAGLGQANSALGGHWPNSGAGPLPGFGKFTGQIALMRFYHNELTAADVDALYNTIGNQPPVVVGAGVPDQMISTSNPTLEVPLFPHFEDPDDADSELTYTVTMNTDGVLIQTDPISSTDGVLTINTPCTLIGTADITVTATDPCGLSVSDTFTVEVKDDVDPVISGAKDMFLNAPVGGTVTTNFSGITAADKVDANPMLMCVPNDSFAFPVGSTEVTCTATDASNNSTEEKFTVHVFAIQPVAGARTMTLETLRGDDAPGAGAMGVPAGSSLLVHYTGAMNNGGDVLYSASLSDAGTNNRAVFLRSAGSDAPLAVRNIAAPGASTYGTFSDVTLNNAGSVGFQSATDLGAGHFLDDGVSIHDAATATQTATGTTGEYRVLRKPALTSGGDLLTVSNLKSGVGGVDAKNDTGLWRTATGGVRTLVARESEMSPIASTNYSQIFSRVVASPDNNLYAFSSFLIELPAFNSSNNTGLFVGTVGGSIAVMAREGDPVPNEPGAVIGQFAGEAVNSSGNVAFRGNAKGTGISTANNEGIWWTDGTTLRTIAREGSVAPCLPDELAAFGRFEKVSICDNGSVFFYAFLTDATGTPSVTSANDGSIWRWDPGDGLHLVARESDVALSTDGAQHGTLYDFDCNQVGGIVYHGTFVPDSGDTTSKTRDGVWLASDANDIAPVLVLRRGDTLMLDIDGEMVEHFVANIKLDAQSNPNGGTGGYGKVINDSGEILLNLSLNKNKSGLFKLAMP